MIAFILPDRLILSVVGCEILPQPWFIGCQYGANSVRLRRAPPVRRDCGHRLYQLKVEVNGQIHLLQAGEQLIIPQGVPHQWWNEGAEAAQLTVTFAPALNTETFLEQFFGLCNNGKTSADGTPNFLQLMAMVNEYDLYVAGPPLPIQKLMGIVLGGFARLIGLKKFYPEFSK